MESGVWFRACTNIKRVGYSLPGLGQLWARSDGGDKGRSVSETWMQGFVATVLKGWCCWGGGLYSLQLESSIRTTERKPNPWFISSMAYLFRNCDHKETLEKLQFTVS